MVKVHTFVVSSLQGLPVHLTKLEPDVAVAVKVTGAFKIYVSSQSLGQFIKVSPLVTVPVAPFFKVVTTLSLFGPWKIALMDFFMSMVVLHIGFVASQPNGVGFHPRKVERVAGFA